MRSASLLTLLVVLAWARPVAACSPPSPCLPAAVLLDDGGATVPPNLAAVPLRLPNLPGWRMVTVTARLSMSARLPGATEPMWTDEIEVAIECPDPARSLPTTPVRAVTATGCAVTPGARGAAPIVVALAVLLARRRRRPAS